MDEFFRVSVNARSLSISFTLFKGKCDPRCCRNFCLTLVKFDRGQVVESVTSGDHCKPLRSRLFTRGYWEEY